MTADKKTRVDLPFLDLLIDQVKQLPERDPYRYLDCAPVERHEEIERRQQALLEKVEDLISERFVVLQDLWCEVNPDASRQWDDDFTPTCLVLSCWADDSDRYDRQRWRLGEFLRGLRDACDKLDQERIDVICSGERIPESSDAWEDLSQNKQLCVERLLAVERGQKLSEQDLAKALGRDPGSLKRELADLVKRKILGNRRGEGYWVRLVPRGIPPRIRPPNR